MNMDYMVKALIIEAIMRADKDFENFDTLLNPYSHHSRISAFDET